MFGSPNSLNSRSDNSRIRSRVRRGVLFCMLGFPRLCSVSVASITLTDYSSKSVGFRIAESIRHIVEVLRHLKQGRTIPASDQAVCAADSFRQCLVLCSRVGSKRRNDHCAMRGMQLGCESGEAPSSVRARRQDHLMKELHFLLALQADRFLIWFGRSPHCLGSTTVSIT
jgi:hypothetical protein